MEREKRFGVIQVPDLNWPPALEIPSRRFRLLVAADITHVSTQTVSDFALAALNHGMVYFCAWGPDCERFHDIMDEVVVEDDIGERKFAGPNISDNIMTTWHSKEPLEEALDFLARFAVPTDGFAPESGRVEHAWNWRAVPWATADAATPRADYVELSIETGAAPFRFQKGAGFSQSDARESPRSARAPFTHTVKGCGTRQSRAELRRHTVSQIESCLKMSHPPGTLFLIVCPHGSRV